MSVEPGRRRREARTGGRGEAPPWSARGLIQVRQVSQIDDFKNVDAQLQCETALSVKGLNSLKYKCVDFITAGLPETRPSGGEKEIRAGFEGAD